MGKGIPRKLSPVIVTQLQRELSEHPDTDFVDYFLDGFTFGFDTGLAHLPEWPFECDNLLSAQRQTESTTELIQT